MNWRGSIRRSFPYIIAIIGGFLLAYLIVAFVIFPAGVIPSDVKVPNVVGLSYEDAAVRVERAGFKAERGQQRFHGSAPKGTVLEQAPPAGSQDVVGATVTLAVSAGQRMGTVPVVSGLSRAQAEAAIEEAGFTSGEVTQEANEAPRGQVIGTRPAGGTQMPMPNPVSVVVSSGPSVVIVPDVVGRNFTDASLLLQQVGLAVGDVNSLDGTALEGGSMILAQTPAAGNQVSRGARIDLRIGAPIGQPLGAPVIPPVGAGPPER